MPRFYAQDRRAACDVVQDPCPEADGSHIALPALVPKQQHHLAAVLGSKIRRVGAQQQTIDVFGAHAGLSPISFLRRAARTSASSRRASARTTDRPSVVSR